MISHGSFFRCAAQGKLPQLQSYLRDLDENDRVKLINSADDMGFSILHFAAYGDQVPMIRWILSDSGGRAMGFTNVLQRASDGLTAVHIAIQYCNFASVRALAEGCKAENGERAELMNALNNDGLSILHWATNFGREEIIKWLLSKSGGRAAGFKHIALKGKSGYTALHIACRDGNLPCAQAIVEGSNVETGERAQLLNAMRDDTMTALHAAAYHGFDSIVRLLVSRGATVTTRVRDENTALHCAAQQGHLACVTALAETKNVELMNALNGQGYSALHVASSCGHLPVVKWLLSDSGGRAAGFKRVVMKDNKERNALHAAIIGGHLPCVQAIMEGSKVQNGEREALINGLACDSWTVLHVATLEGKEAIIRWLLSDNRGTAFGFKRVVDKAGDGSTALHFAALNDSFAFFKAVVDGCKPNEKQQLLNAVTNKNETVLHWARNLSLVQWLFSESGGKAAGLKSSTITAISKDGLSALHAPVMRSVEAVRILLSNSTLFERLMLFVCVDKKHGWTVLHYNARYGASSVIRELLLHHPETKTIANARDRRGMTALHRMVLKGGWDAESRAEWALDRQLDEQDRMAVIEALLMFVPSDDDDEGEDEQQQASLDVNLGVKI